MASGEISLGIDGKLQGRIVWSSTSNGSAANSSNVTATIQAARTDAYGPTTGTWTGNLNIGGTNQTFSIHTAINADWVSLHSFTVTVPHNNDGTGSCYIQGTVIGPSGTSMAGKSVSGEQTVTLDTIPRYANFTEHYISAITTNSIAVSWNADAGCDAVQCSLNNSGWFDVSLSTQYWIGNLSPNTYYSIRTRIKRTDSQLWTESGYIYATTEQVTPVIYNFYNYSKTINSITCAFNCDFAHTFYYRINEGGWTQGGNNVTNGAFTFSGLAPNTTYKIDLICRNWINQSQGTVKDAWSTIYVATYNYATITSAPNINFGDTARITKTNPSGAYNRLRVETLNPTATFATRENIGDDYTITFTDEEWDSLYRLLGNNNSITIRYVIDTIADTTYYHWVDKILTLKGNQKTGHVKVGTWKRTKRWIKIDGSWKRRVRWIKINGSWKRCI